MPKTNTLARTALHWSLGLMLIIESSRFAFGPSGAKAFHHLGLPQWVRPTIGISEILAAILFLIPASVVAGGRLLLAVFAIAAGIHILHGEFDVLPLVVFAMAVLVIITAQDREP